MSPEGNFAGNIIVQGNAVGAALISGHHNQVIVIYGSEMLRGNPAEFSHLLENKAPPVPAGEAGPNPYQSLNAFDETCSHLFFGREELVDRLVAKLATLKPGSDTPHRLLAIMGPSGCGKSSVVRAGVVPRLVRGDVQGLEKALVVILQPGPHPVEALGLALARLATGDPAPAAKSREFGDLLLRSATGSTFDGLARLARMLRPYRAPLIVLIDQFEETWTLSRPTDRDAGERALAERRAFVCTLMHAATERDGNVIILLTLRSDFFGATAEFPDLNRAIANQPEITPVMSREELRAAISEPAKVAGHPLEHSMISRLLDEMEGQDSGLPLLQFALYQIWEGFHQRQTGHETLDRLEGVGGALASRAEEIFRSLPDERRRGLVRRAFEEMVQLGEGARDTRRRACLNDIVPRGSSEGDLSEALEPFVQERLISKGTNEKNQVVAELAHEALIRHWRMLRRWIEERRSDLRFGRRVQQTAIEWRDSNCPRGRLWRSPDLELLESYVRRYPQGITELGEKFFRSSTRARQRRQAFITIGIAGIASVAVVFAILYQRTERARSVAEAQKLAAQSDSTLAESSRYLERSALLAIESAKLQPLLENDNLLRVALALLPRHVAYIIHGGTVRDVHFSPDGRYVATASDDGSARIFDTETGKEVGRVIHKDAVVAAQFSPDSRYVATASDDKSVRVFDIATGKETAYLEHNDAVSSVQFSPDGRSIATKTADKTARIFDVATGAEVARIEPDKAISSIQFSPDARYVGTTSATKGARVLEMATGNEISRLNYKGGVSSIQFSRDSRYLAASNADMSVGVFEIATGREVAHVTHQATVSSVQFSADGQYLATGSVDKSVRVFETATGREIARLSHRAAISIIQFSPDSRYLATGGMDAIAQVFEVRTGQEIARLRHEGAVSSIQFSPDSRYLATGSVDQSARIFEAKTGEEITHVNHQDVVSAVQFSPVGRFLMSSSYDKSVRVSSAMGREVAQVDHPGVIRSIQYSPDGRYLAIGSLDWSARVYEAATGKEIARVNHDGVVSSVRFSTDNRYVASGGADNSARIFEAATGKPIVRLDHGGWVRSVQFSPDGRYLGTGSGDSIAHIFETATGEEIDRLSHMDPVIGVQFSADSRYAATVSEDKSVRVFEINTGKEIARVNHEGAVSSMQFSPDGRFVATGSTDKSARIFEAMTGREIALMSHDNTVTDIQFSRDGRYLATNSYDNSFKVFEVTTRKEIFRINHESRILDINFNLSGQYVATGGEDGKTRVFDTSTGKEIARIKHDGQVWSVQFSADGRSIRSLASKPGWIGVYSELLAPEDLIVEVCRRLTRNLTYQEWKTYLSGASYRRTCPEIPEGS